MKKIIICAMLLITATATFSQQSNPSPTLIKQDYLKKSKHQQTTPVVNTDYLKKSKIQKTIAWVLIGDGVLLTTAGILAKDSVHILFGPTEKNKDKKIYYIAGGVSALLSIPFFISSARNKRKGMVISFKNQQVPQMQDNSFIFRAVPSLNFKISL
jgi:hypothetical protein